MKSLALADERKKAGKVYADEKEATETKAESFSSKAKSMLPEMDMALPDVKTLLNDSDLLTVQAGKALQDSYHVEQKKLKSLKAKLPNKEKLTYYQDKVKALGKIKVTSLDDIAKIQQQYTAIKAEFTADQALIKDAKAQVVASKTLLAKQAADLKVAPSKDWQVIEKKYQLESIDAEDFAHILFGEQARGYFQKAVWLYEKIAPFLEDGESTDTDIDEKTHVKGQFVYFKEATPLPSVLIKKALLSMTLPQGDFSIKAAELTHQHWVRGQDSLLSITSQTNGDISFDSRFKLTQESTFISDGNWSVTNRTIANAHLTDTKALTISVDKAQLNGEGTFTLVNSKIKGDILANNHLSLTQASYQGVASNKVTTLLLDTLESLDSLTIDIDVDGQLNDPNLSISSSLNEALTGAFKKQVGDKVSEFKQKVNAGLNDKLASALKLGDNQAAELLDLEVLLTDTDKALADLKNSDVVEQKKQELKDKLKNKAKDKVKDKLKGKLGDFFG